MGRAAVILAGSLMAVCLAWGFALQAGQGLETSAAFLSWGAAARPVSMGEAVSALGLDASSMDYNPAALAATGGGVQAGFQRYLADINGTQFSAALKTAWGGFGLGFRNIDYGQVADNSLDGGGQLQSRTVHPTGQALSLGYGLPMQGLGGLQLGLSGGWWSQDLGSGRQSGFLGSGGMRMPVPGLKGFALAAALNRLGTASDGGSVPTELRIGLGYHGSQWEAGLDWAAPKQGSGSLGTGLEFRPVKGLALRAGYLADDAASLTLNQGLSLGFGLAIAGFALDYAYLPSGDVGFTQRITLGLEFGAAQ